MIGQTISHYKILEKLGEGGMGIVYKAEDLKLKRTVALKFLPPSVSSSGEELARFQQEAEAISALNHPNIATIYDVDEVDGKKFLALEFISGGTLKSKIKKLKAEGKQFSNTEVVNYAIQIAEGLGHAHRNQIIHRDIKSDNVMLTGEGKIKITDFGLAKLRGANQLTKTGSTIGTLAYMAPEQIQGENVDARADIFSLGVVIFEMLTGTMPFRGEHEAAIMYSILNEDPQPIEQINSSVPPELIQIVKGTLAKNPDARYQSMQDVVRDLSEFQSSASVSSASVRNEKRKPNSVKLFRPAILVPALVVLAAVVAGLVFFGHGDATIDSIAVLPFVNQSHDPDAEYLSDGITEQIINTLSQIPSVRVIPRSTVFSYKGKAIQAQAIGEQLKVKAVLTGRVLQRGDNLNIQTELIDVGRQSQLWGEQYTRKMTDLLELQGDIASQISSNLRLRLTREEKKKLARRYTENNEAYQLYLKGKFLIQKITPEDVSKGLELLQQSLKLDPNFPLPYIGIAYYNLIATDFYISPAEAMPEVEKNARRVLELDPDISEAHTFLASYELWYDWDWATAEKEFLRAEALNPNSCAAPEFYSWLLITQHRTAEALQQAAEAAKLEPLSVEPQAFYALMLLFARRYDESLVELQKASELDPNYPFVFLIRGLLYAQQGKTSEEITLFRKAHELFAAPWSHARLAYGFARSGKKTEALAILDSLKNEEKTKYVSWDMVASVYVALGDKDKAFEYLEKGYQERAGWMIWLKVDPIWDPLHSDRRFEALTKKMNLP
jgi:serine/threonine protein kinase/Tfp pilus assembly protein PilF